MTVREERRENKKGFLGPVDRVARELQPARHVAHVRMSAAAGMRCKGQAQYEVGLARISKRDV